jgi:hypothetical protein
MVIKTNQLTLYREKVAGLFSDKNKTHKYSLCGQHVQLLNVKCLVHRVTSRPREVKS